MLEVTQQVENGLGVFVDEEKKDVLERRIHSNYTGVSKRGITL